MKIILAISLLFTLFIIGCPKPMPVFSGKLYQGDSAHTGITRNNPNEPMEFISASDPVFDKFTCTQTEALVDYIVEVQHLVNHCSCH